MNENLIEDIGGKESYSNINSTGFEGPLLMF